MLYQRRENSERGIPRMQETGVPTQKSGIPKTRKKVGSRMNRCGSPIVVSLDWFSGRRVRQLYEGVGETSQ